MGWKKLSNVEKGLIIGAGVGFVLSVINITNLVTITSALSWFVYCGKICYGYWRQITFLEIIIVSTLIGALIGFIIGKVKSRRK